MNVSDMDAKSAEMLDKGTFLASSESCTDVSGTQVSDKGTFLVGCEKSNKQRPNDGTSHRPHDEVSSLIGKWQALWSKMLGLGKVSNQSLNEPNWAKKINLFLIEEIGLFGQLYSESLIQCTEMLRQ